MALELQMYLTPALECCKIFDYANQGNKKNRSGILRYKCLHKPDD